jgi:hypothetical protein
MSDEEAYNPKRVGLKSYAVGRRRRPSTFVDEEQDYAEGFSALLLLHAGGDWALRPTA